MTVGEASASLVPTAQCIQKMPSGERTLPWTGRPATLVDSATPLPGRTRRAQCAGAVKKPAVQFPGVAQAAPASVLTRPHLKATPMPPNRMTRNWDVTGWVCVDDLLETHVAPALVLSRYAQSRSRFPGEQDGKAQRSLHVPIALHDIRQRCTGKQRAQPVRTEAHWSNVGEFKQRLDELFGPGDIARGTGKGPKNAKSDPHHSASAAQGEMPTDQGDLQSVVEERRGVDDYEEDTDSTTRIRRRARPGKAGLSRTEPQRRPS
ncbi:hypothetical protein OH77DRAFT_1428151 [Trametes cingulata]|nr:hypothetical protein OH77DRAFT_1428151 [Trametes cingulata]